MQQRYVFSLLGFVTAFLGYLLESTARPRFFGSSYVVYKILYYCGYLITQILAGIRADHNEGKYVVGVGIIGLSIFTLLPQLIDGVFGINLRLVLWVITSFFKGLILPGLAALICRWTPLKERTTIGAFVFGGTIFGMATKELLVIIFEDSDGYAPHYIIGACGIVWAIFWLFYPEKMFLGETPSEHVQNNLPPVPWYHMLTSLALWSLIAAQIGHSWAFGPMIIYSDLYHNYSDPGISYFSRYIVMWLCCLVVSWRVDKIIHKKELSVTNARKLGINGGLLSGFFIILTYYIVDEGSSFASPLVLFYFMLLGCGYSSLKINAIDLSPNYAGTIVGISDGISTCIVDWLLPYFINYTLNIYDLTTNIYIGFGLIIATNIPYFIFGRGDVQPWN